MFGIIKKKFMELLSVCTSGIFAGSLASNSERSIKCVYLIHQICQVTPLYSILSVYWPC